MGKKRKEQKKDALARNIASKVIMKINVANYIKGPKWQKPLSLFQTMTS